MRRFELIAVLALACGARTELDSPSGTSDASRPLRIAFFGDPGLNDESALKQFLSTYGTVVRTQTDDTPLSADVLASVDVVILDQLVRDYSADEAAAFAIWIASGGAVLSLTGYLNKPSDFTRPNSLIEHALDAFYEPGLVLAGPSPESITEFEPHTITTGLTSVVFWGGYVISSGTEWSGVAIANGLFVGVARDYGKGRIFMWGDEWLEYTSSWSEPDTKRFWSNAMTWLTHS